MVSLDIFFAGGWLVLFHFVVRLIFFVFELKFDIRHHVLVDGLWAPDLVRNRRVWIGVISAPPFINVSSSASVSASGLLDLGRSLVGVSIRVSGRSLELLVGIGIAGFMVLGVFAL
eukprot:CAMPEP_0197005466 /NCGR_PEP_ID=MMETSP1380-20130617/29489_1 /TAXON_ID=5936 /ORGANISM="Euplotes crassus, Strain CT5" /LENGTH=115 /DNA_ID=CAMNT_0042424619 /DNA_START=371 /DNA_END=718 /DNA_ORIENTATION=-